MSERVTMPALGESVTEGTVTRWLKNVGDTVEVDEPLLEVSTDKVDTEIPSPVAGILQEILVGEDEPSRSAPTSRSSATAPAAVRQWRPEATQAAEAPAAEQPAAEDPQPSSPPPSSPPPSSPPSRAAPRRRRRRGARRRPVRRLRRGHRR